MCLLSKFSALLSCCCLDWKGQNLEQLETSESQEMSIPRPNIDTSDTQFIFYCMNV